MSQRISISPLNRLSRIFLRSFPPRSQKLQRAWVLTYLGGMVQLFTLFFILLYSLLELPVPAIICLYGFLSVFVEYWMIFRKKWTRLAAHFYCLTTVIFFCGFSWFSGAIDSPFIPWLATAPIVAAITLPSRDTLLWVLIGLALMAAQVVLEPYAPPKSYLGYPEMASSIRGIAYGSFFLFALSIILIYDQVRKDLDRYERLAAREGEAEGMDLREHLAGREAERQRIAREFHDHLGTVLTVLRLRHQGLPEESPAAQTFYKELAEVAGFLNSISRGYSVHSLRDFGLEKVVEKMLLELEAEKGIETELIVDAGETTNFSTLEIDFFRMVQILVEVCRLDPQVQFVSFQFLTLDQRVQFLAELEGFSSLEIATQHPGWTELLDRGRVEGADLTVEFSPQRGLTLIYENKLTQT